MALESLITKNENRGLTFPIYLGKITFTDEFFVTRIMPTGFSEKIKGALSETASLISRYAAVYSAEKEVNTASSEEDML